MTNAISVSITMHHHLYLTFILILIKDTNSRQLKKMKYYDYHGCYKEEYRPGGKIPWFFHLKYHPLISASLSLCLLHCVVQKFTFAALDKEYCGCAHEIGDLANKKTDDGSCTFMCSMEPFANTPCGGPQYQSVYEVQHSSILNVYVGCYHVHPLDASLEWKVLSENSPFAYETKQLDDATASYCVKHCAKSGFKYAAIYHGLTCGCDHVIKSKTKSIMSMYCTYPCIDLKMGTCGAQEGPGISIYRCDDFGLKWMKKAIDTTFLKKELKIKDEPAEGSDESERKLGKTEKKELGKNTKKDDYYDEADAKDEKAKKEKTEKEEGEGKEEGGSNSVAIIGGCVAGVVIVGGGVGGFIWWKRKQKAGGGKSKKDEDDDDDDDEDDDDEDDEEKQKKKAKKQKKKNEAKVADIKNSKNLSTKDVKLPKIEDLKYKTETEPVKKKKKSYRSSPPKKSSKSNKPSSKDDPKKPLLKKDKKKKTK